MAVVTDELVNGAGGEADVLKMLEQAGWGAVILPPRWYPRAVKSQLLEQFAEHIEEFLRHGYEVVCIGRCEALGKPLARLGVPMPPAVAPENLADFVSQRPVKPAVR